MRGHHHAGLGAVGVDRRAAAPRRRSARAPPRERRRRAAGSPTSGPVWYIGPTTRWVPNSANLFLARSSTCSATVLPPANIVGGSSTPLGRPVVPEVYMRLGRGRDVGGRLGVGRRGEPRVPRRDALGGLAPPPDHEVDARPDGPRPDPTSAVSGPTNSTRASESAQDEGHLVGVEVEVHRHGRRPGQQAAEVRQHHLGGVLGEHRHAAGVAEVERIEPVGDPVQTVVDVGPRQGHEIVAQGDLVGTLLGQPRCHQCHRAESNHAPARTRRGRPPGRRPAPERVSVSRPGTRRYCPRRRRSRRSGPANPSPRRTAASRRTRRCRRP